MTLQNLFLNKTMRALEVRLLEGCGSPMLDDSVKRAVWKTQPLPVASARKQAGRLEIDFSP